jgi:hypothetical membrane protein
MKQEAVASDRATRLKTARKVLLFCGILASLLAIGIDILAAMLYPGYSYTDQAVSELSAIGASTRPLLFASGMVYNSLMVAFGAGVWLSAGQKRSLCVTGALLAAYGLQGFIGWLFPMTPRGGETATTDVMHLIFSGLTVLLILLFIGFGSAARGRGFRLYSIATILTILVAGTLTGMQAQAIREGQPTPWVGLIERSMVYGDLLWVLVLGVVLLQAERQQEAIPAAITDKSVEN